MFSQRPYHCTKPVHAATKNWYICIFGISLFISGLMLSTKG